MTIVKRFRENEFTCSLFIFFFILNGKTYHKIIKVYKQKLN